ncbi:MAG: erythromycin esterase [Acidobacteria bacterium]|nr:MAG: erythromycin esterase [Acidobacteriota bacterium]
MRAAGKERLISESALVSAVRREVHPLAGAPSDYDLLINVFDSAPRALLGEASHGTHEFYRQRAEITKRLIREKGFTAVAVEADWPDAYRVNRYVRGESNDADAAEALSGFRRFPTRMWRNADVRDFVGWLRAHNGGMPPEKKVGFYGLDLYSLHASMGAVLGYLDKVDPEAARRARYRYACFDHFGEDTQAYGYAATVGMTPGCEDEVVRQLVEMRQRAADYAQRDGRIARDEYFFAEQNARLVRNAERYYRAMFQGRVSSWNLRDTHMAETLDALARFLESEAREPKIVVWAHNSHLGDARATELGGAGELNLGQLVRQKSGEEAILLGFTTYTGSVTAASDWDAPAEYEALFHDVGIPRFSLDLRGDGDAARALSEPRLERAIGVIYRPETERSSHYFSARLPQQFDVVIHFDETRAVEPLERNSEWVGEEAPETYPSAL